MLTLIILLLLVRVLTVEEYGIYVILVTGMELVLAITSLGLPWAVARYLPEFRLRASGKMLAHFVWQAMALISLFLVMGILLLLWILSWLLSSMELEQFTDLARLYLLVMLLEGLGRHVQENALGPLLQQGWVQISLGGAKPNFFIVAGYRGYSGDGSSASGSTGRIGGIGAGRCAGIVRIGPVLA